jgi:hypothetical protein
MENVVCVRGASAIISHVIDVSVTAFTYGFHTTHISVLQFGACVSLTCDARHDQTGQRLQPITEPIGTDGQTDRQTDAEGYQLSSAGAVR